MNVSNFSTRLLAAVALSSAASLAHATFSLTTVSGTTAPATYAASFAAGTASIDSFNGLAINSDLATNSLTRAVGPVNYTVSTETNLYTIQTNVIGGSSLTVEGNADTLKFTFNNAANWQVYNVGARFGITELTANNWVGGTPASPVTMTVRALDVNGLTQDLSFAQTISNGEPLFFRLNSTVALQSIQLLPPSVGANPAGNPLVYATVDNLVVQAVPEPSAALLLLVGLGGLGLLKRRRS